MATTTASTKQAGPPHSDFPVFSDGDVAVALTATKIYRLHSTILRRNSSLFATLFDKAPPAKLSKKAREEGLAAYRFELVKDEYDAVGSFVRRDVNDSGRTSSRNFVLPDFGNGLTSNTRLQQWDWLFRCFYNKPPDFDDTNFGTLLNDCMGLVEVAERVGSLERVCEVVDLALLRQDNVLWVCIAKNPEAWAEVGRRVQSPTIFKESLCHLVGRWHEVAEHVKNSLHPHIRDVCQKRWDELELAKRAIELRILGHYPDFLCRVAGDKPGRPSYASDIYMWMTICFFRQWYTQAISDHRAAKAPDGGWAFYNALAKGGQAYLSHEDFQKFHQYFPMSSKACNVLETNMAVYKEEVKPFVKDIVVSHVHIGSNDPDAAVRWLTCTVIEKEDFPWYKPEKGEKKKKKEKKQGDDDNAEEFDDDLSRPEGLATYAVEDGSAKESFLPVRASNRWRKAATTVGTTAAPSSETMLPGLTLLDSDTVLGEDDIDYGALMEY